MLKAKRKIALYESRFYLVYCLKGENVSAKAEKWNPVLGVSGEVYSVLGDSSTFPLLKLV